MSEPSFKSQRIALTTCGSPEEAARLAQELVSRRLAACVNVVPGMRSFYWWNGQVQDDTEVLLMIKTRVELLPQLEAAINELHSYELPEFVVLPIVDGSSAYLAWIDANVNQTS
ncbi:MAG: divalent-cation tolerance protein CutA [Acidobacteria bacterium]|nr:divalent-cation tolerance protein CutA [Acidobacteriota bacterium]MDA1234299.1 divalent-cation tolerance protein CutA [Acidobacteriota bacterium]